MLRGIFFIIVIIPGVHPRISTLHSSAKVTIKKNNDPYGVLSISAPDPAVVTEPGSIALTVRRTGKS